MRYYQLGRDASPRLAVRTADGDDAYDLTAAKPGLRTFGDLASAASITETPIDAVATNLLEDAPVCTDELPGRASDEADERSGTDPNTDAQRTDPFPPPFEATEVWAAGVTYSISEEAREAESSMPDMYVDVYDSERPEIFFKATPSRTVGPNDDVGIRGDSEWDVPEPELGIVLFRGEIVGYTIGNDMSSRSIEGENPLYLPQAKVYDRCCSLGPCVRSAESIDDPHDLEMWMTIGRDGDAIYEDSTSTAEMVRTVDELVGYLGRHNVVPERSVLLTGTSLVPDDDFTLEEGDVVEIGIEEIGTLRNTVVEV